MHTHRHTLHIFNLQKVHILNPSEHSKKLTQSTDEVFLWLEMLPNDLATSLNGRIQRLGILPKIKRLCYFKQK